MVPTEVERECLVDVAVRWGTGYDSVGRSFVNIIATPKGGTHQQGFELGLMKVIRAQVEQNARRLKVGNDKLEKDDIMAGLTVVLTVRLPEPQFEGQTKEVLGTPAVRQIVANVVSRELAARFASTKRDDKNQTALLLDKIVSEMKARISARTHKETQRRKNALESSSLPAKLADCRTNDVAESELFIVEGDSALGTAKHARNSEYQALLPIRGKILNVQKASISDMLGNAECASIIQVIGAGSGRSFDIEQARYGKVILMSDADVDGAHIRTLLLTLFFRYMRPLIEHGRVYAAVPPLHRVVVMNPGSKPNETIYTYSEQELHGLLAQARQVGQAMAGARAALQGTRRDGCRAARDDDDGSRRPHSATRAPRGCRGGDVGLRAPHGQRGRSSPGVHRELQRSPVARGDRRLTRAGRPSADRRADGRDDSVERHARSIPFRTGGRQRARRAVRGHGTRVCADPREREGVFTAEEALRAHTAGRPSLRGELGDSPTPSPCRHRSRRAPASCRRS